MGWDQCVVGTDGTFSWNRVEEIIQFTDVVLDECRQLVMDHHVESDVTVTVLSVLGAVISVFGVLLLVTRLICIIRTRFHHQRLDDISLHSIEEDRLQFDISSRICYSWIRYIQMQIILIADDILFIFMSLLVIQVLSIHIVRFQTGQGHYYVREIIWIIGLQFTIFDGYFV